MEPVTCARTGCGRKRMGACSSMCHLLSGNHEESLIADAQRVADQRYAVDPTFEPTGPSTDWFDPTL